VKLTLEQVRHVAKLARLKLTPEEELKHQQQLSQVLDAFEALSKIDTSEVLPTYHVNLEHTTLREDVAETPLTVDEALANAPQRSGYSFGVPKVIE
jgi:aspartyl-tRNA(Asn)/glutamyl-tRNA(Gln) amidotransferase subunit C